MDLSHIVRLSNKWRAKHHVAEITKFIFVDSFIPMHLKILNMHLHFLTRHFILFPMHLKIKTNILSMFFTLIM